MYTVQQLATLFNTTKNTIYTKLKHDKMKQFVKDGDRGIVMEDEGLSTLQLLLGESKAIVNKHKIKEIKRFSNENKDIIYEMLVEKFTVELKGKERLIERLERENEKLERRLERAETQNTEVLERVFEQMQKQFSEQKLLSDGKQNIFQKLFTAKRFKNIE